MFRGKHRFVRNFLDVGLYKRYKCLQRSSYIILSSSLLLGSSGAPTLRMRFRRKNITIMFLKQTGNLLMNIPFCLVRSTNKTQVYHSLAYQSIRIVIREHIQILKGTAELYSAWPGLQLKQPSCVSHMCSLV